jgi:hypothetical protein
MLTDAAFMSSMGDCAEGSVGTATGKVRRITCRKVNFHREDVRTYQVVVVVQQHSATSQEDSCLHSAFGR